MSTSSCSQIPAQNKGPLCREKPAWVAYVSAMIFCLAILAWVLRLWRADLRIPLYYWAGWDVFSYGMLVKGVIENPWYLHNRFVGMPAGLDFHDFPMADNVHFLLIKIMSFLAPDYAIVLNIYFLLTFPLTALTSLFVFRRFGVAHPLAMVGGLLFAFLPYFLRRGEGHLFYVACYLIPLMVMVILWVCLGERFFFFDKGNRNLIRPWVSSKFIISLVICALVASGGIYYAFFAGFFLLVSGMFAFSYHKSLQSLIAAGTFAIVIFCVFLANVSPSLLYFTQHGRNEVAAKRDLGEAEIYGLKIVQLILPVSDHRFPPLARLKADYNRQAPLVNENDTSSLGAIASVGFLVLLGWLLYGKHNGRHAELFRSLSVLNIAAILFATIGGFGSFFALLVSPQIRAYNRISVYIAFFSVFAVVLLLDNLGQRAAQSQAKQWLFHGLLALILAFGILDQTTSGLAPPYERMYEEYASDAEFIRRIEAVTPENAMIFQLPYVPFPEHPPVHRMIDYDLSRGYLHSKTLRWSYGAMKGRGGDVWQHRVAAKPLDRMLEDLAFAGFSGIYLDRYGYADQGVALESQLAKILGAGPFVSSNARLVFFDLAEFNQKLREQYPAEQWRRKQEAALSVPLVSHWGGGCSVLEGTLTNNWRWCSSEGELHIRNPSQRSKKVMLEMSLATGYDEFSPLRIDSPWFTEQLAVNREGQVLFRSVVIPPGGSVIRFASDAKRVNAPGDPRTLVFKVMNFRLEESGEN